MILPFPEYRPDVADYQGASTKVATNVVPRADGYGPFKDQVVYSAALPAACRGYFYARKSDGSVKIFAGTSNRLFLLNNTDFTWTPVSKVTALTSISNASPAVFTLNSHGLANGDQIVLSTTGALPTGLTVGTVYYVINTATNTFNVSLTSGGAAVNTSSAGSGTHSMTYFYTSLTSSSHWQLAQFGNLVIAVQANVAPQVFDLSSATAFSDLGGAPPQAAYISIVGRFVVLTGHLSNPYRIQWSGLGDATNWTSGSNSSDYQDLPDGGIVRGVAGGEFGAIFQESTIRRMTYVPGSPLIFSIDRIAQDVGLFAPYSLISNGNVNFFLSAQGFMRMPIGGVPEPIGKERVDRTFQADYDSGSLQLIIGSTEPESTRVYWAYKSQAGATGLFDKILSFDFVLNRWGGVISSSGEYLASLSRPGLTLDALDSISGSLDALTFSLDDVAPAALAKLSAVNSSHKLCFYTGANLEATIDTAEQALDGQRRVRVRGLRPLTDSANCYGSISSRERIQDTASYSTEQLVDARGLCPANVSTRLARGHIRIPAGETWSYAMGCEPVFQQEGRR